MPFACANYLTIIITEFMEHPVTSIAAGRPPLAATQTRNSKIRHSSRIDARRRPSSVPSRGSGLQKQGIPRLPRPGCGWAFPLLDLIVEELR
jgi:hypothetical protein